MITVVQKDFEYIIKFPYDTTLINIIKSIPGRRWDAANKSWIIPTNRLGFLLARLKDTSYESQVQVYSDEQIGKNDDLPSSANIPDIDLSGVPLYVQEGSALFSHQLDCIKFAIDRHNHNIDCGFILADEPGAGKTLQVLNLAMYNKKFRNVRHCLIITCVNSAKYNWVSDIIKHTNGNEVPYILGSRLKKDGTVKVGTSSEDKLSDLVCGHIYGDNSKEGLPYFLVLNIEALRMKRNRHYPIREQIVHLINNGYIGMIAVDEVHVNTSPTSIQGKQLLKIKQDSVRTIEWVPMTGTPIVNKPTDVYLPLKLVDGHTYKSFYSWRDHFCIFGGFGGHEIIAYKNIPELKQLLQTNMLRRLKSEVLDLPPKIHVIDYVENTSYQDTLYHKVLLDLNSHRDDIVSALNPMAKLLRLRQVNGTPELVDLSLTVDSSYLAKNAKLTRLLDLVSDLVSNNKKVVIFSNWSESLRTIYTFLSKQYKVCCYTGAMSSDDREKHKQKFIESSDYPILIGTIGALGTSHTLTCSNDIIFYDEPWNLAAMEQAEDRCHRPGATNPVTIYSLITKDTIDEKVHNLILNKGDLSKFIVDDNLDLRSNPALLDLLLGHK